MPSEPHRIEAERKRSRLLAATAIVLAVLGVAAGVSHRMTQQMAEHSLRASAQALLPVLSARLPEIPPLPPNLRVTLLDSRAQPLADSQERLGDFTGLHARPEVLQALVSGEGLRSNAGELSLCVALPSVDAAKVGYALFRSPQDVLAPGRIQLFWILLAILGSLLLCLVRFIHYLGEPRRELLSEIDRLRGGDLGEPVFLPIHHLYRPVADTLNRLSEGLERQTRILAEQHHRQQVLLNSMSEGIVVLDNEQKIIGLNPSAAQWLELGNPVRAQGKALYTLCRNPALLSLVDQLTSTESMCEELLVLERPGEEDRSVLLRGSPLIDRDQTVGALLLLQDVTTLRRLETLRQDFVANVSHELRTPLTAIKGYAELLAEEIGDAAAVAQYSERILRQSSRMVNIIDDLLALTRIENADSPPALQPTELRPLLETVMQLCEENASRRNLEIVMECAENLRPPLHPPLFEQAVHNLLHNAVKYTHPQTRILLKAFARNGRVVIEITDQGPGIAAVHQPRLFERFYRVDKARSRAVGGTGLGLSIVKHIAQLHHGSVGLRSTPGQGATFWIEVPA